MGVTYKLRKDVVDLIIDKKKEVPSLSCRKLVAIVREAFQIEVSKSSINAIIKEYNLSNPVGRASAKNFFIPKDKKEQLLAEVKPFLHELKDDSMAQGNILTTGVLSSINVVDSDVNISKPPNMGLIDNIEDATFEQATLSPDLLARNQADVVQDVSFDVRGSYIWAEEAYPIINNLGISILYVALLDILSGQLTEELFVGIAGNIMEGRRLFEAGVLFKGLGYERGKEIEQAQALSVWTLLGQEQPLMDSSFHTLLNDIDSNKSLAAAIDVEVAVAVVDNAYFSFESNKAQHYLLRHDLGCFLDKVPEAHMCSIVKSVENAVDRVACPVKPLVLRCSEGLTDAIKETLMFLSGAAEEKPVKICLWGGAKDLLWEGRLDPSKKINFIAGFNIESCFFDKLLFDETGTPQKVYNAILDQYYSMIDGFCQFTDADKQSEILRGLVVKVPGNEKKLFFITNLLAGQASAKDIVDHYLEKFSCLENFHNDHDATATNKQRYLQIENTDHTAPGVVLKKMLNICQVYLAQRYGLDNVELLSSIYTLSGYLQRRNGSVFVRLVVPQGFGGRDQLATLLRKINGVDIAERNRQKWWFSIENKA